jgi:hypothetical protein
MQADGMPKPAGRRLRVQVDGRVIECCTIGELAEALQRSVHTVRAWERRGLLPGSPMVLPSTRPQAVRRLYPLELVDAVREVVEREGFGVRRPSGRFGDQAEALHDAWESVMAHLFEDDVVTDRVEVMP